jgi:sugar lactone lactonase YvrE
VAEPVQVGDITCVLDAKAQLGECPVWSVDEQAHYRVDIRSIPLPCSNPTAPCFGGPDLRTIFVTSLRHGVAPDVLAAKPLSGGIFAVRVDVPGVPIARYRG